MKFSKQKYSKFTYRVMIRDRNGKTVCLANEDTRKSARHIKKVFSKSYAGIWIEQFRTIR